jgi:hypothetical protein
MAPKACEQQGPHTPDSSFRAQQLAGIQITQLLDGHTHVVTALPAVWERTQGMSGALDQLHDFIPLGSFLRQHPFG